MSIQFKDNPNLGENIVSMKVFCKLLEDMQTPSYEYIVGEFNNPNMHGLVGHKWSRLCGFVFKTTKNTKFQNFEFIYVPKLRGSRTRNWNGMHGWYCWMYVGADNKQVLSIEDMMRIYGFSVDQFVHSDMFEYWVPKFVSNAQFVLDHQIKDLISLASDEDLRNELFNRINSTSNSTVEDLERLLSMATDLSNDISKRRTLITYATSIKESLAEIFDVQQIVSTGEYERAAAYKRGTYSQGSEPKPGHAKIAFNADKTYGLVNIDAKAQVDANKNIDNINDRIDIDDI